MPSNQRSLLRIACEAAAAKVARGAERALAAEERAPAARARPPAKRMSLRRPRVCAPVLAIVLLQLGCHRVPPGRSAVLDVTVRGEEAIDADEIKDKIATTASERFLGIFPGLVYEYSLFDHNVLQKDLARVEALYRSRGFYDVRARAGRVHRQGPRRVRVEIVVTEGAPVTVRRLRIEGMAGVPEPIAELAHRNAQSILKLGAPFDEALFDQARESVRRTLTDHGYAYAQIKGRATVDLVHHAADVFFETTPGEPCVFGPVTIEGLDGLPDMPVRRALDIVPGEPFSEHELEVAQRAALDLGVFASVVVEPQRSDAPPRDRRVPIRVRVEPSRLRTIKVGGGIELDAIKTDVHGIFGWESRNFLGGLRSLSLSVSPGVVLYPLRVNNLEAPKRLLPEGRVRVELRQPGFLAPRANAFVRPELHVQALLLDPDPQPDARVIGYAESRNSVGLDRFFPSFYGAISHSLHLAYPFAYIGDRDPTLGTLVISYPELVTQLDFRNSRVRTRSGFWLGNTLQVAGGPFGGQADDVKVQPDARVYIPLQRRVVLAMRGSVGLLFPRNYGAEIDRPPSLFAPSAALTRSYQLTFFRGFFSGGPSSNRGYPLRGISPHAYVPFISPELEEQRVRSACGEGLDCRTPTGGFTLWEASVELRFDVAGPFAVTVFCDASDVSPRAANIRLTHPHLSCGAGGRYETPIGPVRLDVGYRIPGMQVLGGLTPDEREPQTFPLGIPIAISVGIGEAY